MISKKIKNKIKYFFSKVFTQLRIKINKYNKWYNVCIVH